MMVDVSLVSSLYRTEKFLPHYAEHLLRLAKEAREAGLALEIVIIPNEATETERRIIEQLQQDADVAQTVSLQIFYVPRENLHASWNRGVQAAQGKVIGFWNVDDIRYLAGLTEAYELIVEQGYDIVDFPVQYEITRSRFGRTYIETEIGPAHFEPDTIHPNGVTGPFFMFTPELYRLAGAFEENFPIAGDFEWCMRDAVRKANYKKGQGIAGQFFLHDDNITQSNRVSDKIVFNVVLLRHGVRKGLYPVNPNLMREVWDDWGHAGVELPQDLQDWLWGETAAERFQAYEQYRASKWNQRWQVWLGRLGFRELPKDYFAPPNPSSESPPHKQ
jgi:hypothetical protein